ncbi:TDT family transporter [Garciella nitratireducens]|uniref:Exfoliative toxin A/B n=1 Tax=Garciella nitratireducens DSM 15102 TaxID=1121911 RepID=A0A1T4KEQ3_9FIRM|nr:TDT family transporter [Garciella nitratireducens]RBP42763.1 exfoliative toxin A/B [Garciella nitratireducens]SJZ40856.1 exfoliative toxin A/B [Garciella nitratireducens DSM 15102]
MKEFLEKYPLPISGLILGLASLGNLVQSYGSLFRNILGSIAGIFYFLFLMKLIVYPQQVKKDLKNPVIASVFPTLSMSTMLLSTYLNAYFPQFAFIFWLIGFFLHGCLILWFTTKFVVKFNIKQVFPSWFIVYVGIVVASVTSNIYEVEFIGKITFWFGFITYFILLYPILYRILKVKEMPEISLPTLVILAAPASLLLAGYLNTFTRKSLIMLFLLMGTSFAFYIVILILLPKLLKLKFYPSYSAFTFPLVISAIAMKLSNGFLIKTSPSLSFLSYLVKFQEILAILITLYVLIKYLQYFMPIKKFEINK